MYEYAGIYKKISVSNELVVLPSYRLQWNKGGRSIACLLYVTCVTCGISLSDPPSPLAGSSLAIFGLAYRKGAFHRFHCNHQQMRCIIIILQWPCCFCALPWLSPGYFCSYGPDHMDRTSSDIMSEAADRPPGLRLFFIHKKIAFWVSFFSFLILDF
jgi:hypothetical protein